MSMSPLTAALIISTRTLWEQAHACIQNLPVRIALEQNEPSDAEALLDRIEKHRVDVILLELKGLGIPLEDFVRRAADSSSQPAVFVLHPEASTEHILEALRAGSREFLYPPLGQTLKEAFVSLSMARARSTSSQSLGLGRVVGFLSAKGGCGATTFACNVAPEVARRMGKKVLLADFDFDAGMVRFLLKSKSTWSVRDALDNLHRMDANYWEALVSKHGTGLDVIPSPEDVASRQAASPNEIAHLMRFIRSSYPVAVVDFGRHLSPAALDAASELDLLHIVTSADPIALEQTRNCIAALADRGFDSTKIRVLVNAAPEKGSPDAAEISRMVGMTPAGFYANDHEALYDAWSEGRLLQTSTKLGKQLSALAASIASGGTSESSNGQGQSQAEAAPRESVGGVRKLFSFLQRSHA